MAVFWYRKQIKYCFRAQKYTFLGKKPKKITKMHEKIKK